MANDDLEWLMAVADAIGGRIEQGILPRQDENGFYEFSASDLDVTVKRGGSRERG